MEDFQTSHFADFEQFEFDFGQVKIDFHLFILDLGKLELLYWVWAKR